MTHEDTDLETWDDPIVAEVRKAREELFAAADYDLDKFCQRLREAQAESGSEVVSRSPRRPDKLPGEAA